MSDAWLAADYDTDDVMIVGLNRFQRRSIRSVDGRFWRLHLMAFLDEPAAAHEESLYLAVYDAGASPNGATPVRVFEVPVKPGQKVIKLNDLVLESAMGFVGGHEYELAIQRSPTAAVAETRPAVPVAAPGPRRQVDRAPGPGGPAALARKADMLARGVITLN